MAKKKDSDPPEKAEKVSKPSESAKPKAAAKKSGDEPEKKESLAGKIRATVRRVLKPSAKEATPPEAPPTPAPKKAERPAAKQPEPAPPKKGAPAPKSSEPVAAKAKSAAPKPSAASAPKPAPKKPASVPAERRAAPELEDEPTVRMSAEEAREAAQRMVKLPSAAPAPPAQAIGGGMAPAAAKFEIEPPEAKAPEPTYPEKPRELPTHYDVTRVVLLPRDPDWAFAYWEISKADQERLGIGEGSGAETVALRIHDASGGDALRFDVKVGQPSGSWHIRLPRAGNAWSAELGIAEAEGAFEAICASGPIGATRDAAAAWGEIERWGILDRGALEEIFRISGGEAPPPTRQHAGSSEALVARPTPEQMAAHGGAPAPQLAPAKIPKIGASELTSRMG